MTTPELISYIKDALSKGQSALSIKQSLRAGGWNELDLQEAFSQVQPVQTPPPVPIIQTAPAPVASPAPVIPTIAPVVPGHVSAMVVPKSSHSFLKVVVWLLVLGAVGYGGWWFYTTKITNTSLVPIEESNIEAPIEQPTAEQNEPGTHVLSNYVKADSLTVYYPEDFMLYDGALLPSDGSPATLAQSGSTIKKPMIAFPGNVYSVLVESKDASASRCYRLDAKSSSDFVLSANSATEAVIGWYYPKYQDFEHNSENYKYGHCTIINGQTILIVNQNSVDNPISEEASNIFEEIVRAIQITEVTQITPPALQTPASLNNPSPIVKKTFSAEGQFSFSYDSKATVAEKGPDYYEIGVTGYTTQYDTVAFLPNVPPEYLSPENNPDNSSLKYIGKQKFGDNNYDVYEITTGSLKGRNYILIKNGKVLMIAGLSEKPFYVDLLSVKLN